MPELPYEIWKDRINNEIDNIKKLDVLEENSIKMDRNGVDLILNIKALGFIKRNGNLGPKRAHRIYLKINRSFPYPGGIDFSWLSNIFHPNIHPVELTFSSRQGTGYICLNILKKWSRLSDLVTTIRALKILIENPNPDDPLDYPECTEAAKFFKKQTIEELKEKYSSEENYIDTEKKEDDDIIIIEDD
ncbi:MAG: ubiquitin-conjugating enzyme E2 [Candidatus Hermodarchaeota archaeon]